MLAIRFAQSIDDAVLINKLAEAIWWPTYRAYIPKEQIEEMLNDRYTTDLLFNAFQQGETYLIAFRDDIAVGFAHCAPSKTHNHVMYLEKIYVLQTEQGKGTGKALIEFVQKRALQQGKTHLRLNVNRYNKAAKQFYDRQGFLVIDSVDIPYRSYVLNDFIMEKSLI
jgi:GNAT superfamily N-acetyltransferase